MTHHAHRLSRAAASLCLGLALAAGLAACGPSHAPEASFAPAPRELRCAPDPATVAAKSADGVALATVDSAACEAEHAKASHS